MYQLNEMGKGSKQRHQALENPENEHTARRLRAVDSSTSTGTGSSGARRVRLVPAPGGFAYVED